MLARLAGRRAVAVGFFADHGARSEGDVAGMIERAGPAVAYAGVVGVLPEVADLIVADARAAVAARFPGMLECTRDASHSDVYQSHPAGWLT